MATTNSVTTTPSAFEELQNQNETIANTALPAGAVSYGDYLSLQGISPTAKKSPSTYAEYLGADTTAAKTYGDYLTASGATDPTAYYNEQMATANKQYDRSVATYGQTAEQMAQMGMNNSGFGDYLSGVAYSEKQSASQDALKTKAAIKESNDMSYGSYLESISERDRTNNANYSQYSENYDTTMQAAKSEYGQYLDALKEQQTAEETTLFNNLYASAASGTSVEELVDYAVGNGYDIVTAERIALSAYNLGNKIYSQSAASNYVNGTTGTTDGETTTDVFGDDSASTGTTSTTSDISGKGLYDNLISSGVSEENATAQKTTFQAQVFEYAQNLTSDAATIADVPTVAALKAELDNESITEEQYNTLLSTAQAKRYEAIVNGSEVVELAVIDQMVASGDLTAEQGKQVYSKDISTQIEAGTAKVGKDAVTDMTKALADAELYLSEGKIGQAEYEKLKVETYKEIGSRIESASMGDMETPVSAVMTITLKSDNTETNSKMTFADFLNGDPLEKAREALNISNNDEYEITIPLVTDYREESLTGSDVVKISDTVAVKNGELYGKVNITMTKVAWAKLSTAEKNVLSNEYTASQIKFIYEALGYCNNTNNSDTVISDGVSSGSQL